MSPLSLPGPLVLLADDDVIVRTLGQEVLSAAGFRVVVVESGVRAVEVFETHAPDIVILDVQMPGLDGLEVCRRIRASSRPQVPVLIATGHDDMAAISRAFEAGATDFLNKPVHWAMLPYRLRYALRSGQTLQDLERSQHRARAMLDAIPDQLFLLNAKGVVVEDVRRAAGLSGAQRSEGLAVEDLMPADAARALRESLHQLVVTGAPQTMEFQAEAGQRVHEARLVAQPNETVLAIVRDVTHRNRTEERMRQLAYVDEVTGLPNRTMFLRELRRAMRQAKRTGRRIALLYIDLDRFKRINDTLGHSVGDALLRGVGERLTSVLRPNDCVASTGAEEASPAQLARLGGDEFVAMITDIEFREHAMLVASRIRQQLAAPFNYEQRQFVVSASVGIAVYPDDGTNIEALLMHADTAMYQAKGAGGNAVSVFDTSMNTAAMERLELEEDLRRAVEAGALELHLQPKLSLATGRIVGAEALLRWKHPVRGWVPPGRFIPLAEETGLIAPLGAWVNTEACRILSRWRSGPLSTLSLAVNLSAAQMTRGDVAAEILRSLWDHGVPPWRLEIEMTESLLMRDVKEARRILGSLKDAGLSLALDDFGTGYSSLSYLRQLPLDTIKIDRSFVQHSHVRQDDAAICSAIVAMSKKLGLRIVGEGIEIEEQRDFLCDAGCDHGQGFLFSRPLPAAEFERYALTRAAEILAPPELALVSGG